MSCVHCTNHLCPVARDPLFFLGQRAESMNQILSGVDGNELLTTYRDLQEWSKVGCPLAKFLFENFKNLGQKDNFGDAIVKLEVKFSDDVMYGQVHSLEFRVILKDHKESYYPNISPEEEISFEVFTDAYDNLAPCISRRPVSTELGSEQSLDIARDWISHCTEGHSSCSTGIQSCYPLRLLDVSANSYDDPNIVCLHISAPDQRGPYLALSYCWGTNQTFLTNLANLSSMISAMDMRRMPQTFRDAIYLTRELGHQYIWIDALCIIQDSDHDKADQISQMQDIYRNATFTISASRAPDCHGGFLGPVHFDTEHDPRIVSGNIPYVTVTGVAGCIRLRKLNKYDTTHQPIHKRGWTYQEHFLSRRILFFGDQMMWQCSVGESLSFGLPLQKISPFGMPKVGASAWMWKTISVSVRLMYGMVLRFSDDITNDYATIMLLLAMFDDNHDIEDIITDTTIQKSCADTDTQAAVRDSIAREDFPAFLDVFSPFMVRFFELAIGRPYPVLRNLEMDNDMRTAISMKNGLAILESIAGQVFRIIDGDPELRPSMLESGLQLPPATERANMDILELITTCIAISKEKSDLGEEQDLAAPHWPIVVEQYSQRILSNVQDRLPAFSGIATEFSSSIKGRYVAGLWEKDLLNGLMWHQGIEVVSKQWTPLGIEGERRRPPPRPCKHPYIAPSWSWAAAGGAIQYTEITGVNSSDVEILECEVDLKTPENIYGQITGGILSIEAPFRRVPLTWFTNSLASMRQTRPDVNSSLAYLLEIHPDPWDYNEHDFGLIELFKSSIRDSQHISRGLVLEEVSNDLFKRVGTYKQVCGIHWQWWDYEHEFMIKVIDII